MAKNINGDGTIAPRETKAGTVYDVRLSVRDRRTGLTERISKGGFSTQKAAADWRDTMKRKSRAEGIIRPTAITVPQLVETWLRQSPPSAVSTRENYEYLLERHIKPRLNVAANRLDKTKLMTFFAETLDICKRGPGHGANRICRTIIAAAYRWASKPSVGLVQEVPECLSAKGLIPKPAKGRAMPREKVALLMEAARGKTSYLIWRLMLETAGRRGELLGLNWSDIDFNASTISIRKIASVETNGRELALRTKGKAFRTADISAELLELLRPLRGMPNDPVFPAVRKGGRLSFGVMDGWWHRDCRAAGITGYPPHSLRHTWATEALRSGVPVNVVSSILGHARIATTLEFYVHDSREDQSAASAIVANVFFPIISI